MTKPKAYSYVRFSTPEQAKGDSDRRQTDAAAEYCKRNGLTLDTDLNLRDLGISAFRGANIETGALGAFLTAVEAGDIPAGSVFLVENLDRVSRKAARKALRTLESIVDAGVDVVTLQDGKRYSADSLDGFDFLFAMLILMRGHEESLTKSKRLKAAWVGKRATAESKLLTRIVPGWLRIRNGKPELVADRAKIVRRIFKMFVDGTGKAAIAATLNAEKVPCFGRAQYWHRSYIQKMIASDTVLGVFTPHVEETTATGKTRRVPQEPVRDYFPAVIDAELFERAQAVAANTGKSRSGGKLQNMLAGLARCPKCSSTMTRVQKGPDGGVPRLVCVKAKAGAGCEYHSVSTALVDAALIRSAGVFARNLPKIDADLAAHISAVEQSLEDVGGQLTGLTDLASRNPSDSIAKAIVKLEAKRDKLDVERGKLGAKAKDTESKVLKRRAERLQDALSAKKVNAATVNAALRESFERVTVNYKDGLLEFAWRNDGVLTVVYDTAAMFDDLGPRD